MADLGNGNFTIDASASGNTVVIPGKEGWRIQVIKWIATTNTPVGFRWMSVPPTGDAIALGGEMTVAAGGNGVEQERDPLGHFATLKGHGLAVNLTDAAVFGGYGSFLYIN